MDDSVSENCVNLVSMQQSVSSKALQGLAFVTILHRGSSEKMFAHRHTYKYTLNGTRLVISLSVK